MRFRSPYGRELTPAQREVLGWALCAIGLFMGFVLYGHWQGGGVGRALATGLGVLIGRARWLAPPALVLAGATLLLRPTLAARAGRALRPLRAGALSLAAAIVLALAAGTLGLSPGPASAAHRPAPASTSQWSAAYLEERGGAFGQALWWISHRLVQNVGVTILVVFLLLAGLTLLSGASMPALVRALSVASRAGGRLLRTGADLARRLAARMRARAAGRSALAHGAGHRAGHDAYDRDLQLTFDGARGLGLTGEPGAHEDGAAAPALGSGEEW
ncbi:MAG: hypothetical protein KGJ43_06610, partial [Acidobacteriota bacterium]|nr:hypothetical protein [Acidobacteriota bacterium]